MAGTFWCGRDGGRLTASKWGADFRQTFYPDASRLFDKIERRYGSQNGNLSSLTDFRLTWLSFSALEFPLVLSQQFNLTPALLPRMVAGLTHPIVSMKSKILWLAVALVVLMAGAVAYWRFEQRVRQFSAADLNMSVRNFATMSRVHQADLIEFWYQKQLGRYGTDNGAETVVYRWLEHKAAGNMLSHTPESEDKTAPLQLVLNKLAAHPDGRLSDILGDPALEVLKTEGRMNLWLVRDILSAAPESDLKKMAQAIKEPWVAADPPEAAVTYVERLMDYLGSPEATIRNREEILEVVEDYFYNADSGGVKKLAGVLSELESNAGKTKILAYEAVLGALIEKKQFDHGVGLALQGPDRTSIRARTIWPGITPELFKDAAIGAKIEQAQARLIEQRNKLTGELTAVIAEELAMLLRGGSLPSGERVVIDTGTGLFHVYAGRELTPTEWAKVSFHTTRRERAEIAKWREAISGAKALSGSQILALVREARLEVTRTYYEDTEEVPSLERIEQIAEAVVREHGININPDAKVTIKFQVFVAPGWYGEFPLKINTYAYATIFSIKMPGLLLSERQPYWANAAPWRVTNFSINTSNGMDDLAARKARIYADVEAIFKTTLQNMAESKSLPPLLPLAMDGWAEQEAIRAYRVYQVTGAIGAFDLRGYVRRKGGMEVGASISRFESASHGDFEAMRSLSAAGPTVEMLKSIGLRKKPGSLALTYENNYIVRNIRGDGMQSNPIINMLMDVNYSRIVFVGHFLELFDMQTVFVHEGKYFRSPAMLWGKPLAHDSTQFDAVERMKFRQKTTLELFQNAVSNNP